MKMEPLPANMIEQGRREALNAVRRAIAQQGDPVVNNDNPLGLPLDENGRAPTLRIVRLPQNEAQERIIWCNNLCQFLANREEYVKAFNRLPQHHQMAVILIQEDWEDQPDIAKDCYLRALEY